MVSAVVGFDRGLFRSTRHGGNISDAVVPLDYERVFRCEATGAILTNTILLFELIYVRLGGDRRINITCYQVSLPLSLCGSGARMRACE